MAVVSADAAVMDVAVTGSGSSCSCSAAADAATDVVSADAAMAVDAAASFCAYPR